MIVRRSEFEKAVSALSVSDHYGLDTETTGLTRADRLFSIIIADAVQEWYFNFNSKPDHTGITPNQEWVLPRTWLPKLAPIFSNPESRFYIHNAKFDLSMLAREGLHLAGEVHCTEVFARVLKNNHIGHKPYSLASVGARIGLEKDDAVEKYVKEHKLTKKIAVPGKDKAVELKFFDQVPLSIMAKYATNDARMHLALGIHQKNELRAMDESAPEGAPRLAPLVANERKLTKVCHRIEETGIRINRPYVQGALSYTQQAAASAMQSFRELTGIPYEDSPTTIVEAFKKFGIELPKTRTGKPCTKKEVLDALDNPVADKIREIRSHQKMASTYYSSFLYFADPNDLIHANMRQAGTETGRFSYSDPNLQNLPKEDEEDDRSKPFLVRRSFVPLDPDWCFVPIDFKQQEFRMMLDYAGERELIDLVMSGMDLHEATAQMLGITRKQAKTINFGLLYGMGVAKLAHALKVPLEEAQRLRALYFAKLPRVRYFIRRVMETGEARGYIWNWFGFRNHISSPEFAYALPNHLIQGGCAQVIRIAMVRLDEFLMRNHYRSRILAQVHDELLFQVHRSELHIVPEIQKIMEDVYQPKNGMRLECSVEHSWESWGKFDMKKGAPEEATRAVG